MTIYDWVAHIPEGLLWAWMHLIAWTPMPACMRESVVLASIYEVLVLSILTNLKVLKRLVWTFLFGALVFIVL